MKNQREGNELLPSWFPSKDHSGGFTLVLFPAPPAPPAGPEMEHLSSHLRKIPPPPAPALSILTHRAPVALDLLKPPQLCKLGQLACPPTQPRPGGRLCKQVTGKAFPHGQTLGLAH